MSKRRTDQGEAAWNGGRRMRILTIAAALALLVLTPAGAADAQEPGNVHRIGVLHVGDHIPPGIEPLRAGLRATGWAEGENIQFDVRNLHDEDAARRTADEFLRSRVSLIVAFGDPAVRAAKAVTSQIPIVMVHATDPVAHGFVKSLARPGGNLTGFVYFVVSPAKHVELFKEMVPGLRRLLVLRDPRDPTTAEYVMEIRKAADIFKLELAERDATHQTQLEQVFGSIKRGEIDGVVPASNTLHIKYTATLIRLAFEKRVPLASYRSGAVDDGALFSYAPDDAAVGRDAAMVLDKILRGTKPADIPVEQPRKFELVVNLRTAKSLGLVIPPAVLLRADRVIE